MRFENLPNWNITSEQPGFYDVESGTVIQMVARLYKKIKELIEDYNNFADETNLTYENFKKYVLEELDKQNDIIDDAVKYMKDNFSETCNQLLNDLIDRGELRVLLTYNANNESLNLIVSNNEVENNG